MRKIFVFRVYTYSIEKRPRFFRNKTSPVKTFAVLTADQFELFTCNEFMFTSFAHMSNNKFHTNIFFWNFLYIKRNFCSVVMT